MNDAAQFLISHGGTVLFAFVLLEQAGLPLPAAPLLLAAGALGARGQLNPVLATTLAALAAILADALWFFIGRRSGPRVLRLFCKLSLARNSCVGRSKNLFERHGLRTLVAAKFLPGLGAVMPPLAGAMGMSTSRFLLFDGLGSLVYGGSYIAAGYLFHNQIQQIIAVLNRVGLSALVLSVVLAIGFVGFKYARRRRIARPQNGSVAAANPNVAGSAVEEANVTSEGAFQAGFPFPGERAAAAVRFQELGLPDHGPAQPGRPAAAPELLPTT